MGSIQPPLPGFLPEVSWRPPTEFPDLAGRGAEYIAIDCETRDPHLREQGPGFPRRDAQIVGVSVSAPGFCEYYPVRHAEGPNLAPNIVFDWIGEQVAGNQPKITANGIYDFEGLWYEGIKSWGGTLHDVQIAEPLIDEETAEGYSLEVLAKKYLGVGKDEVLLRTIADMHRKAGAKFDPKKDLWLLSPTYVAEYAKADASLTAEVWKKQMVVIDKMGLRPIYDLELDVLPSLLQMRTHGVRVDLEKAERLRNSLTDDINRIAIGIQELCGKDLNVDSGPQLRAAFEHMNQVHGYGVSFKFLPSGQATFAKEWLDLQRDPLSKLIREKRKLMTLRDDFVIGDILEAHVNGRIYARFHQLRTDEAGTRSGRMSSTSPNLQQVPARDEVWAPEIRSLFLPDEGQLFFKGDYSQQEPRWLIHYAFKAKATGAAEAVAAFNANPKTDYHQYTTDIVNAATGKGFKRKRIKGVNLGIMYTMGLIKLCAQLDVTPEEGSEILADYHGALPFVRALSTLAMTTAQNRGVVRTELGRQQKFNLWEPVPRNQEERREKHKGRPLAEAQIKWMGRRLQRWGTHKALNRLIQGSSADQTKKAIVDMRKSYGLYPQLIVHDECAGSCKDKAEAKLWKTVMENTVRLVIPVVCDMCVGPNWGYAKEEIA